MIRTAFILAALSLCASAQVRYEDILKGPGENWLTYAGTYQGSRYSPLKQITPANASSMVAKWVYHVPNANGLRTSPIVYKGIMYVTNANSVYALDARDGREIWQYVDGRSKKQGVNRGAAIYGDSVYFTTTDNYLTALDRQTGALIFSKRFADSEKGTTSTSAPLALKDKIIVGSAGVGSSNAYWNPYYMRIISRAASAPFRSALVRASLKSSHARGLSNPSCEPCT